MNSRIIGQCLKDWKSQPCPDCVAAGRDGIWPPECMDFDHIPERGVKVGSIKTLLIQATDLSDPNLQAELAKCDVICSNCHRIRTRYRGPSDTVRLKMGKNQAVKKSPESRARASMRAREIASRPGVSAMRITTRRHTYARRRFFKSLVLSSSWTITDGLVGRV